MKSAIGGLSAPEGEHRLNQRQARHPDVKHDTCEAG